MVVEMQAAVVTKENILALVERNKDKVKSLGVKRLGLFGSFIRGEQREDSDVDVLVEFRARQKTFDNFMQLSFWLEDLFKRRVELVTTESLSPYIGPRILDQVQYVSIN